MLLYHDLATNNARSSIQGKINFNLAQPLPQSVRWSKRIEPKSA